MTTRTTGDKTAIETMQPRHAGRSFFSVRKWTHEFVPSLLLLPSILLLLAFAMFPMFFSLWLSFNTWNLADRTATWTFVGLGNFRTILTTDPFFWPSVQVTLVFVGVTVAIQMILGLAIALLLQKDGFWQRVTKSMLIMPFAISAALKGYSWRFMLNENFGIFDLLIDNFIIVPMNFFIGLWNALPFGDLQEISTKIVWLGDAFWAKFMLAFSESWGWAPLIALMFLGALGSIDPHIFESARIDGAGNWALFRRITLPMLRPVLMIIIMLKTIFSLKMFDQVVTMTGGGPIRATQTMNFYVHQVGFVRGLDIGYASAISYILVIALTIVAAGYVMYLLKPEQSGS